ncbi:hypothetical protein [Lacticaseibacillus parakribbianus]|uniref:hypothetical protein n=1 Tax=Lacticaseibacillus parakribbianus TaxID=2970927 RepID=UPI0021CB6A8F|nr:hypothetical protein [Lacticaseibacillus parakribbianus]
MLVQSEISLVKVKNGQDGGEGTPGPPGADGRTSYTHTAYATSADGTTGFSVDNADGNATYWGTCTDFSEADPTDPSVYTWAKFVGPQGAQGADAIVLNITSVNGNMFKNTGISTILTATITISGAVIDTSAKMQSVLGSSAYLEWSEKKVGELEFSTLARDDPRLSDGGFMLTVNVDDVTNKSTFKCDLCE